MSKIQRRFLRNSSFALVLGLFGVFIYQNAVGKGVVTIMASQKLPEASLSVLNPEGGTSTGTAGSEVNLAVGDVLIFRFEFTPAPDGIPFGVNHYLTEYVPDNLEVVGVRLVDANGNTVKPALPGRAVDGCSSGACTLTFNDIGDEYCDSPPCTYDAGSVAQGYGDTGVFYTYDTRLDRMPDNEFLQLTDGMLALVFNAASNRPGEVTPTFDGTLGIAGTWYAHNEWDYLQVQLFGTSHNSSPTITSGRGNTPHLYGSPVAGSNTGYTFEAEEGGGGLSDPELNDTTGPWIRAQYPGSMIAQVTPNVGTGGDDSTRLIGDVSGVGTDITPANSLTSGATIRVAAGQLIIGRPVYLEVAARVDSDFASNPVIDPVHDANVNCGEIFGGGNPADNVWPYYAADPQCVILRAVVNVTAVNPLAPISNANISFEVNVQNLAVLTDETVTLRIQNNQNNAMTYTGIAGGVLEAPCQALDTDSDCTVFSIGDLTPGQELGFVVNTTSGGVGAETLFLKVNYTSAGNSGSSVLGALALPGYTSQAVTQARLIGVPVQTMVWNETSVSAGGTATFTGTLTNDGSDDLTYGGVTFTLPTGWTAVSPMTVNGQNVTCASCGTNEATFTAFSQALAVGASVPFTLSVNVPGGEATDNYTLDAEWTVTLGSFGSGEIYDREIVTVAVGAARSDAPALDCPISSSNPVITGTSGEAAGTVIQVYINLIARGATATVQGDGTWSVDLSSFGGLYAGLDIRATATASGENESVMSVQCTGGVTNTRQCSDGVDNDNDGFTDFPADPGCASPNDNGEDPDLPAAECSNLTDDEGTPDGDIDFGADLQCYGPDDDDESTSGQCTDGNDNDGDGLIDNLDPSCTTNAFDSERDYMACQNGIDDDNDGNIDFPADPGCHSEFDNDETDPGPGSDVIKPRILVVFDTSGSMNSHACADPANSLGTDFTGGDGSFECPGSAVDCTVCDPSGGDPGDSCNNALADDSRLFKVKEGIADVVASFGEVEYGLMRFKQRAQDFGCAGTADNFGSGAWLGGGITPCTPFDEGEMVVSFSPDNTQSYLKWLDHDSNYGAVGGVNEDGVTTPFGLDWELRGTGSTPLAGALDSARSYMYQQIQDDIDANDPAGDCRPYRIILVTDGLESCGGDPVASADDLFDPSGNGMTLPGGGSAPSIPVTVIGFASGNPALAAGLNAIAQAGAAKDAIIVSDEATLSNAIAEIVVGSIVSEVCDGIDNDCDTLIDEGFDLYQACDNSLVNTCFREGDLRCDPTDTLGVVCCDTPVAEDGGTADTLESNVCAILIETDINVLAGDEICNLLDDDCDSKIDEAPALNCNCSPVELCNGIDDDCDGSIDEGTVPGEGIDCGTAIGICSPGVFACCRDGDPNCAVGDLYCSGETPGELEDDFDTDCNGLDDDCDGQVDELVEVCFDGTTIHCPPGQPCNGICRRGVRTCEENDPYGATACEGQVLAGTEICNGIDDDCDGLVDEGFDVGMTCDNGGQGICFANGIIACQLDGTATCTAPSIDPQAEVCDTLDNDCDGTVDEVWDGVNPSDDFVGAPVGEVCGLGVCGGGTFQCCQPGDTTCTPGTIYCDSVNLGGSTEVCNGEDDDCDTLIDESFPEDGADCTPLGGVSFDGRPFEDIGDTGECEFGATVCVGGGLSCANYKEPTPEVCDGLDNDCDGVIDDTATCDADGEICSAGACVAPCPGGETPCPFGFFCGDVEGEDENFCLPDPCLDIACPTGFSCQSNTGTCVDYCDGIDCPSGAFCDNGFCLDCFDVPCAEGELCRDNGNGIGECEIDQCANASCDIGEICRPTDGECVADDLCDSVSCLGGEACDPGTGTCIADPCLNRTCAEGSACSVDVSGAPVCLSDPGVYIFNEGSGGCSTGGETSGTSMMGMLLLLTGFGLSRRRRREWARSIVAAAAVALVALGAPATAQAQGQGQPPMDTAIGLQNFDYAIGARSFITVSDARIATPKQVTANALISFFTDPYSVFIESSGTEISRTQVVGSMVTADLTGSYGLLDWLQLGASLPLVLSMGGDSLDPTSFMTSPGGFSATGLGDMRVEAKMRVHEADDFAVAFAPAITLPTSYGTNGNDYLGDNLPTLRGTFAAQYERGQFRAGTNVGAILRKPRELFETTFGSQLTYGGAAAYKAHPMVDVIVEAFGRIGLVDRSTDNSPAEVGGGVRLYPRPGIQVLAGGGAGLNSGVGAPAYRMFMSVGWAPDYGDDDGDLITNSKDLCPNEAEDKDGFEDTDGCPDLDNDGDRRTDDVDKCPDTKEDFDGFEDFDGCPEPDNDKDGFLDAKDGCPNKAEDGIGAFPKDGCPATESDADDDGVSDAVDKCPNEAEDEDGFADGDGCPEADNDGDGIVDADDSCPVCREDKDGFEDTDGCPELDNDGDGIADSADKCPNQPETLNGVKDEDGCPDTGGRGGVKLEGDRVVLKGEIKFRKTRIRTAGRKLLDQVAVLMKANRNVTKWRVVVAVSGRNAESVANERAAIIRDYLVSKGISADSVILAGIASGRTVVAIGAAERAEEEALVCPAELQAKEPVPTAAPAKAAVPTAAPAAPAKPAAAPSAAPAKPAATKP